MTGKHDELVARPADVWADLEAKARALITECEAEFMLDGMWMNNGQLVSWKTVTDLKDSLKLIEAARRSTESPDQPNGAE